MNTEMVNRRHECWIYCHWSVGVAKVYPGCLVIDKKPVLSAETKYGEVYTGEMYLSHSQESVILG